MPYETTVAVPLGARFPTASIDWKALGRAYLFFWYFSGVIHILLVASGATVALTANIGCLTQLQASLASGGHAMPVHHVAELLAMALPGGRAPE